MVRLEQHVGRRLAPGRQTLLVSATLSERVTAASLTLLICTSKLGVQQSSLSMLVASRCLQRGIVIDSVLRCRAAKFTELP